MTSVRPDNPAEWLVYRCLILTWPFYMLGALYVVGPALGWMLGALACVVLYLGPLVRADLQSSGPVPPVVWAWCFGMGAMLLILWVGHLNWQFTPAQIVRSTIGWAKGWALLALLPLAGAVLPIRREVLVRGQCIVGLWVLCLLPVLIIAPSLGLPQRLYTSPLKILGGPGSEYFAVFLYSVDPSNMSPRWQFFAPWSPFAALLGVTMVLFALEERAPRWRAIGLAAGMAMVLFSKSRMGLVGLMICPLAPRILHRMSLAWTWQILAVMTLLATAFNDIILRQLSLVFLTFKEARADSTRVRATLQRIATERWQEEAFWFGHGRVAPGGHIVEYMPIGSHHTWYGLLFVKGVLGVAALGVPLLWQTGLAVRDCLSSRRGILPLGLLLVFLLMSFGENIEIEVYLFWPSLLILGRHAREAMNREERGRDQATCTGAP